MKTIMPEDTERGAVMTDERGVKRMAGPLLCGLIALFLAACETSTASVDGPTGAALAPQQVQTKPVAFAPVIGAPAKVSARLNELLISTAGAKAMPVVAPKDAEYTIRGYIVAAADPKGTKLSYIWDVSDKANKRRRIQGEELIEGKKGGDPWVVVDDAALQRIAVKAVEEIVAYMPTAVAGADAAAPAPVAAAAPAAAPAPAPVATASSAPVVPASLNTNTPTAQPAPPRAVPAASEKPAPTQVAAVASEPVIAVVAPVTGAPGDGQDSLTAAMRKHLQQAGVKLASGSSGTAYTVKGTVEIGSPVDGQQPITIQWMVVDPSGKTMEKAVVQRNKVAQGSLDGQWGQVADLAAGEAAKSIARLMGRPAG